MLAVDAQAAPGASTPSPAAEHRQDMPVHDHAEDKTHAEQKDAGEQAGDELRGMDRRELLLDNRRLGGLARSQIYL
jgi:hypothetical protein